MPIRFPWTMFPVAPASRPHAIAASHCACAVIEPPPSSTGPAFPDGVAPLVDTDGAGAAISDDFQLTLSGTANQPPVALCKNVTVNADSACQGTRIRSARSTPRWRGRR